MLVQQQTPAASAEAPKGWTCVCETGNIIFYRHGQWRGDWDDKGNGEAKGMQTCVVTVYSYILSAFIKNTFPNCHKSKK
mgnify:CR=1 FL=1